MADFFPIANEVLENMEGGAYTNDPDDPGKETKWGITIGVARENNYSGLMKDMDEATALCIIKKAVWDKLMLDQCKSQKVARELFEASVLVGNGAEIPYLQRTLNVLNRNQQDWPDINVDGGFGPTTRDTLNKALSIGRESNILKALNSFEGFHFITKSERNPVLEKYTNGWFAKRIEF